MSNSPTTASPITSDTRRPNTRRRFNKTASAGSTAGRLQESKSSWWLNARRKFLWKYGELRARIYLYRRGDLLIARNLVIGKSEIDIIAHYRDTLLFVEVKTRREGVGDPFDAIDANKEKFFTD